VLHSDSCVVWTNLVQVKWRGLAHLGLCIVTNGRLKPLYCKWHAWFCNYSWWHTYGLINHSCSHEILVSTGDTSGFKTCMALKPCVDLNHSWLWTTALTSRWPWLQIRMEPREKSYACVKKFNKQLHQNMWPSLTKWDFRKIHHTIKLIVQGYNTTCSFTSQSAGYRHYIQSGREY